MFQSTPIRRIIRNEVEIVVSGHAPAVGEKGPARMRNGSGYKSSRSPLDLANGRDRQGRRAKFLRESLRQELLDAGVKKITVLQSSMIDRYVGLAMQCEAVDARAMDGKCTSIDLRESVRAAGSMRRILAWLKVSGPSIEKTDPADDLQTYMDVAYGDEDDEEDDAPMQSRTKPKRRRVRLEE